jgi:hypothetical protein
MYVSAAVGLLVETDDVDDSDVGDRLGDQVHLGADQIVVGQRDGAGQARNLDVMVVGDRVVGELLEPFLESVGQRIEFEVHARAEWIHVAAGDEPSPLVPHDTTENVHRRVRAHQHVTAIPVDRAGHEGPDRRPCRAVDRVPDRVGVLGPSGPRQSGESSHLGDRDGGLVPRDRAGVVRLPAARRVERATVELDAPVVVDRHHRRGELGQVRVVEV